MYTPSEADQKKLANNFKFHAPNPAQVQKYESIRKNAKGFAELLMTMCPPSRELSIALTELETAVMWANASIARNES